MPNHLSVCRPISLLSLIDLVLTNRPSSEARTAARARRYPTSTYWFGTQMRNSRSDQDMQDMWDEELEAQGFIESRYSPTANRSFRVSTGSRMTSPAPQPLPRAPSFLNAAGEIDLNLIPHAPRTDLPPPPPLVPLPRLTEEPPATWFEGMGEDSRCPVLFQPDYVVEYSFPCGHALCRWCYEQICLVSDRPVCPLCRRRI